MSSRGRGYGGYNSRGSGRGYRGSYRGSNNRGSFESRGGRGGYSSYNDTRYNSGNRYSSNRDRIEESYKKPYRSESSSNYSSRDFGGRSGSPERKRLRMEGSSDRRSHDGGGHYYNSRQESYVSERRPFGEERRRSPSRDARDPYRKSGGMPPPRSPPRVSAPRSRVSRPTRRSFRGRTLRTRGSYRGSIRSRASFTARRYGDRTLGYTRAFKTLKGRSSSIKSKEASSTEDDWDAEDKEEEIKEKDIKIKSSPEEEPQEEGEEVEDAVGAEGEDTDKEGADAASEEGEAPRRVPTRASLNLSCVHCKEKYPTFGSYSKHLLSGKHRAAMSGVARRHKAQLLRMRVAQRTAQREIEASGGAELASRTTFCLICRLNHRTTRQAHNMTDTHRAMKRFLMPFCRMCRMTFRSPMLYEHHVSSVEHLKRKAQVARRPSPKPDAGSGDEVMDVDLENFMTLDSVGDVDEVDDEDSGGEKKDEETVKKAKVEINVGSEYIKKMEVLWCELCRVYLPRCAGAEQAEALRRHCRLRLHLGRFVQHRDTRTLRKHAERIHRKLHEAKDGEKENKSEEAALKVKAEKTETGNEKQLENGGTEATNANTEGNEDKLWADVDELLREVEPQEHEASDDDDDLDRYDKFRKSDKTAKVDGDDTEANAEENTNGKQKSEVNATA